LRFRRTGATKDSKRRARRERRRRRARDRSATMARDDVASQRDDARKRREKRRELRTAIDAARVNQEELQKPECDDLERAVDAADAMNEGVDKPREMCLDMEHYGQLAAFSLERTKRLGPRGGAAVSAKAFLQSLRRRWGEEVRWERLGTGAGKFFREAPAPGFMNGVMDTEIKERRATQRRAREALGPSVAPDEVRDTAAERQTDKMMIAMNKKLKKQPGGATDVVRGTNNPESFPQFVENVFTAAFLVKDGNAGIVPSATGGAPTLSHTTPPASGNDRSSFVLHMDMGNWRALNAMLGGTDGCMMPTREDVDEDVLYGARAKDERHEVTPKRERKRVRADDNGDTALGLHDTTNYRNVRESFSVST